ncbi:hypothetical protein G6F51_014095 [Rhizopus arrhizus]|uniref:Uncharacterized protein n=1 Tax=Rhizopus oryzae TaxID=64495 RepID=A0A9P7BZZ4_RHIOR|nr:hypothetical protein G6F51_014095 [Rhizopus arrhizus]
MKTSGIDPDYKPHSIRSASSTKATVKGMSKKKVKEHAHWSLNTDTFEKRYLKPPMKIHNSTKAQDIAKAAYLSSSEAK